MWPLGPHLPSPASPSCTAGLPPPVPAPPVRWLRVPGDGFEAAVAEVALPAVLPAGQVERGATGLELLLPDVPSDGLQGLGSPPKRKAPWSGGGGGGGKKKVGAKVLQPVGRWQVRAACVGEAHRRLT